MKTRLLRLSLAMLAMISVTGVKAEEVQPRATTTWLFNQFYEGTIQTITTTSSEKSIVYLFDRLYLCIGDANVNRERKLTATAATSMPNGTAPAVSDYTPFAKGDYVGLTFSTKSRTPVANSADNVSNYNLAAVKPKVAGKLYVLANTKTAGNKITIYRSATQIASASRSTTEWILVSCDVEADNRYFIGCQDEDEWTLYGVKFVPNEDKTDLTQHDISVNVKNGYATFSSACNYKLPSGYKAYVVSDVNATSATLTKIDHIPSNTGVILVGDAGNTEVITMKNIRESDITDADKTNAASNQLIANVGEYALPASYGSDYNYILTTDGFKHSSGSGTLAANKAFLRTTTNVTSPSAPGFTLDFGTGTTGITEIEKSVNAGNEAVFNLNGQRVAQPKKGLYIVNGKKVIIK